MLEPPAAREKLWPMRLLIALAVVISFGYAINGEFLGWDDWELILGNSNLNPPTVRGLMSLWRRADQQMYIPVVYSAWWGLAHLGMKPAAFHGANLLLHLASAMVVFQILLRLVDSRWAA